MSNTRLVIVASLIITSTPAFAGDRTELVCAGVAKAGNDDKLPMFVHFNEQRAPDGTSRTELVTNEYQGTLYKSTFLNKTGAPAKDAPLVLKSGTRVRFRGTYTLEHDATGFRLKLTGKLSADPTAKKPTFHDVTEALPCVDLSI